MSVLLLWVYLKNKSKLALYFSTFFFLFAINGPLRMMNTIAGDEIWFFLQRISITFGTIVILQALKEAGVKWIEKYKIIPISMIVSVVLAYFETYVAGGPIAEKNLSIATFLTLGVGSAGFIISGCYFYILGKNLPSVGKNILAFNFVAYGILFFVAPFMIRAGLLNVAYLLGLLFATLIGVGWWLSLTKKQERLI